MDVRPKDATPKTRVRSLKVERLLDLPAEILIYIFSYLSPKDLGRLARSCRRLRHLARDDVLWARLLTTSGFVKHVRPLEASASHPSDNYEVARVGHNWATGTYDAIRIISFSKKQLPRVLVVGDRDGLSTDKTSFLSTRDRTIEERTIPPNHLPTTNSRVRTIFAGLESDATDFAVADGHLFAVSFRGELAVWRLDDEEGRFSRTETKLAGKSSGGGKRRGKKKEYELTIRDPICVIRDAHDSDVHAIAASDETILTGSKDTYVKVWKVYATTNDDSVVEFSFAIPTNDRVWSVARSPMEGTFASGTAALNGIPPLRTWDSETGICVSVFGGENVDVRNGAGVLHLHYETPQILASAGYDGYFRLWDVRTPNFPALQMEDPFDNAVYCAWSDASSSIVVTGTARHSVVNVWDRRRATLPIRMIYADVSNKIQAHKQSSPVYSLVVDWDRMFVANDVGISALDFRKTRSLNEEVPGSFSYRHHNETG